MNRKTPLFRAIGLMSGTSMDGVDIAFIETDGEGAVRFGPTGFQPYDDADRALLRAALAEAAGLEARERRPGAVAAAEEMVTRRHGEAVQRFLLEKGLGPGDIDLIGFHGQTVLHRPQQRLTIQIGDGAALARHLGAPVVYDFRAADVAAGGQGAPVVPVYHRALVEAAAMPQPVALLNLGGVANVTYVDGASDPIACDTGPGNALIDDLMHARIGEALDRHGLTAACGRVDEDALSALLDDPFFAAPPPKSLDRNAFSRAPVDKLSLEDAAATLTAFTAASVAKLLPHLPRPPALLVVCGGGARNPILLRELTQRLPCRVTTADKVGWSGDAMEAQAFAYLAVRAKRGLPLTFPSTTGVLQPISGGVLAKP
ncbi:MAG: anhydro-N-acetylmuramic acid kinase [Hyphomicrobiales bacterium]|nr:anhydro-N-acetylmuramic acid kinase [Hyphomicrobiales bacterium]